MDLQETESRVTKLSSAKRGPQERDGIFAWFPYYAGFSAAFVVDVIDKLALPRGSVVFDPMNGSGTTTVVAQQRECLALSAELNPAMAIIARGKDAVLAGRAEELESVLACLHRVWRDSEGVESPNAETKKWIP